MYEFIAYPTLVSKIEDSLKIEYFFDFQRILQSWKIFAFQRYLFRKWRKLGYIISDQRPHYKYIA